MFRFAFEIWLTTWERLVGLFHYSTPVKLAVYQTR